MDPFWKKHNRRIGKILDAKGLGDTWSVIDQYLDIDGVPDPGRVAEAIGPRLIATYLGHVLDVRADSVRVATSGGTRYLYATRLIIDHLRELNVPATVLIRSGYPIPTVSGRVYPTDRTTNLEVIGKARRKKPMLGDVFAYSFDKTTFYWGQVVQDDLEYMGATTLIICFKSGTSSLTTLPDVSADELLLEPMAVDAGAWRRGFFVTAGNLPARVGRFEWIGWTPSSNLDVTLSIAHGVPVLAPP